MCNCVYVCRWSVSVNLNLRLKKIFIFDWKALRQ